MIKVFAILIGSSFAIGCVALSCIQLLARDVFLSNFHREQLPGLTRLCIAFTPTVSLIPAVFGLIYPTTLLLKKEVKAEPVLVYTGVIALVSVLLFFSLTAALLLPLVPPLER